MRNSDKKFIAVVAVVVTLVLSIIIGFWGTVIYVAHHFIAKHW